MTNQEIEVELLRLTAELMAAVELQRAAGKEWGNAENDYRRAKSIAFLNSEGTVDARKAKVDQACERERLRAHIAESDKEACRATVYALETAISAVQTIAKCNLAEMAMTGLPQPRWGGSEKQSGYTPF